MSRPYKEVILFDNIQNKRGARLFVNTDTNYKLKQSTIHRIWTGSIDKFIADFELPIDSVIDTARAGLGEQISQEGSFVTEWDFTTINFKFNYQVWFKSPAENNTDNAYVLGSNNTINVTIPNVIVFNGKAEAGAQEPIFYAVPNNVPYNPNIFPLPISISSFVVSNRSNDFQAVTGYSTDSLVYLMFRFGVNGNDIEICLLTKNNNSFQVNQQSLVIPYASLTFTGFNKVKRLN